MNLSRMQVGVAGVVVSIVAFALTFHPVFLLTSFGFGVLCGVWKGMQLTGDFA